MRLVILLLGLGLMSSCGDPGTQAASDTTRPSHELGLQELLERSAQYINVGSYELAIKDLEAAIRLDSLNPLIYHRLADAQLDYYQSHNALTTMIETSKKFPSHLHTQLKLSEFHYTLEQYDESMKVIDAILKKDPQLDEAYFMMGMNFKAKGDIDNAIKSFQRTTEVNGDHHDGWLMLGTLYSSKGDELALKCFDNAILINPKSVEAMHNKAFHLQNTNRIEEAKKLYRQINAQNPQYTDAFFNTGILYLEQDSLAQALEHFNIAVKTDPQYAMGYYYLGITYEKLNNSKAALEMYDQALRIVPEFVRAKDAAEYLRAKTEG